MRQKEAAVLLLCVLCLSSVSALDIEAKDTFKKGETFLAQISGNFVDPPLPEQVTFYRGHVRIPLDFELIEFEDVFYLSARLPEQEGNFSFEVDGPRYYVGSTLYDEEIKYPFVIQNETAAFWVRPGVLTTRDDFSVTVQNLLTKTITLSVGETAEAAPLPEPASFWSSLFSPPDPTPDEEDAVTKSYDAKDAVSLKTGEIKNIAFSIDEFTESSFQKIRLSAEGDYYEIPVYIFVNASEDKVLKEFVFDQEEIQLTMLTQTNRTRKLELTNNNERTLYNITLSLSGPLTKFVTVTPDEIEELAYNESEEILLSFVSTNEAKYLKGQLQAKDEDNFYTFTAIALNITPSFPSNYSYSGNESGNETGNDSLERVLLSCDELGGIACPAGEVCTGEAVIATNGPCCLDRVCEEVTAETPPTEGSSVVGWVIIILLIVVAGWFYLKKYKGAKRDTALISRKK